MLLYIQINNLKANFQHSPASRKHDSPGNPGAFLLLQIQYQLTQTQQLTDAPQPLLFQRASFLFWKSEQQQRCTRSPIQACQLSDCYEQEHSGVTSSFCKVVPPQ